MCETPQRNLQQPLACDWTTSPRRRFYLDFPRLIRATSLAAAIAAAPLHGHRTTLTLHAAPPDKLPASDRHVNSRAGDSPAGSAPPHRGALSQDEIAQYRFQRDEDQNFDGFPDGWTRHHDRQHPAYLPIQVVPHDAQLKQTLQAFDLWILPFWQKLRQRWPQLPALPPAAADQLVNHYLRMELDGGAARIIGPVVAIDRSYRFQLRGHTMTESLRHNHARAELLFVDADGETLLGVPGPSLSGTRSWTAWETPLKAAPAGSVGVRVALRLEPSRQGPARDIHGAAGFDDLVVLSFPQVRLATDRRLGVYRESDEPLINLRVMGLRQRGVTARFSLLAPDGRQLQSTAVPITALVSELDRDESQQAETDEAQGQWQLPSLSPGFYTVRVKLDDSSQRGRPIETTLAVVADLGTVAKQSPFGWTLPQGLRGEEGRADSEVDLRRFPDWLSRVGVHQLKFPLWLDPEDRQSLASAAWLAERLNQANIRCIGVLADPPPRIQSLIDQRDQRQPLAANLFRDAATWQPLLEPVMTRLSIRVPTWQLGFDDDHSFLGRPELPTAIRDINRGLQGYGQPINVAIPWPWLEPLPKAVAAVVGATNRTNGEPLTAEELNAMLTGAAQRDVGNSETWVALNPLNRHLYDLDTRIRDLLIRMATIRSHQVSGAYVSDARAPEFDLLRPDWRPGALLVPWRTGTLLLGDLHRVGEIPLDNDVSNIVLASQKRMVVMLWSPQPTEETLYLGHQTRHLDAWGNQLPVEPVKRQNTPAHRLQVGPVPSFLVDVDPLITHLRMSARLQQTHLDSLLGQRQQVRLMISNPTESTLSGTATLREPADWIVESPPQVYDLQAGENKTLTFNVVLRNNARMGDIPLVFHFQLGHQDDGRFTLTRNIKVGPVGLDVETETRIVNRRALVRVTFRNTADDSRRYDCFLFPPGGGQYQRRQVTVPAGATVHRDFSWDNGDEMVGKTLLLRAIESQAGRILNRPITITP